MQIIILSSAEESPRSVLSNNDDKLEEYEENVAALKKIVKTKSSAKQTVQELLSATRDLWLKWLSSAPASIHNIFEKGRSPQMGRSEGIHHSVHYSICVCNSVVSTVLRDSIYLIIINNHCYAISASTAVT